MLRECARAVWLSAELRSPRNGGSTTVHRGDFLVNKAHRRTSICAISIASDLLNRLRESPSRIRALRPMDDTGNNSLPRRGYFQQYLARMAPAPLPPPPLPLPVPTNRPVQLLRAPSAGHKSRKEAGTWKGKSKPTETRKTLVDAFKQHGMKLCDGSKLNAVSKGVTHLGLIPPTLGIHITSLYLSQNNLRGLDGVEQFKNVRLLSVVANLLVQFSSVERLKGLSQLRHLNLTGNPLCSHPNYRLRVVDALPQLIVLDTIEISRHERDVASTVASQDRALREMVMKNHLEVQKLQHIAVWIRVLSELQCLVVRDAVTGRFAQLPNLQVDCMMNVDRFLRVWRVEDSLSEKERNALETQMMAIVARTRSKLVEDAPQSKAKEMLLKLANVPHISSHPNGNSSMLPMEIRHDHSAWENAYIQVLQLQQQTMGNLRGECEHNQKAMAQSLRQLLVMNPYQRRASSKRENCNSASARESRRFRTEGQINLRCRARRNGDLSQSESKSTSRDRSTPNTSTDDQSALRERKSRKLSGCQNENPTFQQTLGSRRALRSGDFGNKTLHEAIQSFSLREPVVPKRATSRGVRAALEANSSVVSTCCDTDVFVIPSSAEIPPLVTMSKTRSFAECQSALENTASETMCSADTSYAPSVGWTSNDAHSEFDLAMNSPVVVTSRAQIARSHDNVIHQQTSTPELMTVVETDRFGDTPQVRTWDFSDRQNKLEEREEKYIAALMDSEQRELDLRHQVCCMSKQIAQFQRIVSDNERERLRIRAEINERALAVSRPKVIRRFFEKWIQFREWTQQLRHFLIKQQIVSQHDAFWCWRRQVWARQQLRRIQKRFAARLLHRHLTEWANLTRISIIAVHTQALRHTQLAQRVLSEWRQRVYIKNLSKRMKRSERHKWLICLSKRVFAAWKRETVRGAQTRYLHRFYKRHTTSVLKRVVFAQWKVYVLSIARPLRTRVANTVLLKRSKTQNQHFGAWKRLTKCKRLRRLLLERKLWSAWRGFVRRDKIERERLLTSRVEHLRAHFREWRVAAVDRAASRRSLTLAMRHVNHRRMRKLWMYWKIYSIARKRHVQGVSKARKHFYIKLIRRSWTRWKQETRANLVSVKQNKRHELSTHFNAFKKGVRWLRDEKRRIVFAVHAEKRRQHRRMRSAFSIWASSAKRHKRCKFLREYISRQRSRTLACFVWFRWRQKRLVKLQNRLCQSRQVIRAEVIKREEVEKALTLANEEVTSLRESVEYLNAKVAGQLSDIKAYQDEIIEREGGVVALEKQLAEVKNVVVHSAEIHREDILKSVSENKGQRDQIEKLQNENTQLRRQLDELLTQCETDRCSALSLVEEKVTIQAGFEELRREYEELKRASGERERSLCASVADLEKRVEREQRERDETVHRLQEYETRIARTCAEIEDHEHAYEQECMRLRAENSRIDALWKEESVRNVELQRLLSEKNEQIIALSVQLQDSQWSKGVTQGDAINRRSRVSKTSSHVKDTGDYLTSPTAQENSGTDIMIPDTSNLHPKSSPANASMSLCAHFDSEYDVPQQKAEHSTQTIQALFTKLEESNQVEIQPIAPSEEECQIDAHTSQIHADIQMLQERINKRLQQIPCLPDTRQILQPLGPRHIAFDSDGASLSTLSESDHETNSRRLHRSSNANQKVISTQVKPQQRQFSNKSERENLASNRLNSQPSPLTRLVKIRHEMQVPRRPSGCPTDTAKPKKRSSTRLHARSGVST